jgi:hypothetical protein
LVKTDEEKHGGKTTSEWILENEAMGRLGIHPQNFTDFDDRAKTSAEYEAFKRETMLEYRALISNSSGLAEFGVSELETCAAAAAAAAAAAGLNELEMSELEMSRIRNKCAVRNPRSSP